MRIESFGITDTGMARDTNEDAILVKGDARLFVVADGVGGLRAGELASGIAVGVLLSELGSAGPRSTLWSMLKRRNDSTISELTEAIENAHMEIRRQADDGSTSGMASTIVAVVIRENRVTVAHVGDSRVYRMRQGELQALTTDHSALAEFLAAGVALTEEQKASFPYRNVITRALGFEGDIEISIGRTEAVVGDVFLLCSDGLTKHLRDDELANILQAADSARSACTALVALANQRGGEDNISVVVARVQD